MLLSTRNSRILVLDNDSHLHLEHAAQQLVRIQQENKNKKQELSDKDLLYCPQITKDRINTSSPKMVNENQEVSTVSSDLSKEKHTSPSTSIQPPQGQQQESEKKISNCFEVELDPFTTVVLSQL